MVAGVAAAALAARSAPRSETSRENSVALVCSISS